MLARSAPSILMLDAFILQPKTFKPVAWIFTSKSGEMKQNLIGDEFSF